MKKLYPIFLGINAKRCVVVGGGQVAERRAKMLSDCGARVKVVSPRVSPGLEEMAEKEIIEVVRRKFCLSDLEDAFLAIAASDQPEVNAMVVEKAKQKNILVDSSTKPAESDFILPSVVRSGDLTIAISTTGESPALARMIREELEQDLGPELGTLSKLISEVRTELKEKGIHITFEEWRDSIDSGLMELIKAGEMSTARDRLIQNLTHKGERTILVVGANHNTAPVELRERLALSKDQLDEVFTSLVDQGAILNTCNRTEIYAVVSDVEEGCLNIEQLISQCCGLSQKELSGHLYTYQERDAVKHLFEVCSGVDSMVLGDEQILGQVRETMNAARSSGVLKYPLLRLFQEALRVGRKVRSRCGLSQHGSSVSRAGYAIAQKIFGDIRPCSVLIVGAGQMGRLTTKLMKGGGARQIIITSRTQEKAASLAARFGAQAIPFDEFAKYLASSDIVVSSTSASGFILTKDDIQEVMVERRNKPLLLIDLSVPRDIDPEVRKLPNVLLYDIDDLKEISFSDLQERQLLEARAIIDSEAAKFMDWWYGLEAVPTIMELRGRVENIRSSELKKGLRKIPRLSKDERDQIDNLTRSMINKILHHPTITLKDKNKGEEYRSVVEDFLNIKGK
jgi:glutamyl-tRNA reductase